MLTGTPVTPFNIGFDGLSRATIPQIENGDIYQIGQQVRPVDEQPAEFVYVIDKLNGLESEKIVIRIQDQTTQKALLDYIHQFYPDMQVSSFLNDPSKLERFIKSHNILKQARDGRLIFDIVGYNTAPFDVYSIKQNHSVTAIDQNTANMKALLGTASAAVLRASGAKTVHEQALYQGRYPNGRIKFIMITKLAKGMRNFDHAEKLVMVNRKQEKVLMEHEAIKEGNFELEKLRENALFIAGSENDHDNVVCTLRHEPHLELVSPYDFGAHLIHMLVIDDSGAVGLQGQNKGILINAPKDEQFFMFNTSRSLGESDKIINFIDRNFRFNKIFLEKYKNFGIFHDSTLNTHMKGIYIIDRLRTGRLPPSELLEQYEEEFGSILNELEKDADLAVLEGYQEKLRLLKVSEEQRLVDLKAEFEKYSHTLVEHQKKLTTINERIEISLENVRFYNMAITQIAAVKQILLASHKILLNKFSKMMQWAPVGLELVDNLRKLCSETSAYTKHAKKHARVHLKHLLVSFEKEVNWDLHLKKHKKSAQFFYEITPAVWSHAIYDILSDFIKKLNLESRRKMSVDSGSGKIMFSAAHVFEILEMFRESTIAEYKEQGLFEQEKLAERETRFIELSRHLSERLAERLVKNYDIHFMDISDEDYARIVGESPELAEIKDEKEEEAQEKREREEKEKKEREKEKKEKEENEGKEKEEEGEEEETEEEEEKDEKEEKENEAPEAEGEDKEELENEKEVEETEGPELEQEAGEVEGLEVEKESEANETEKNEKEEGGEKEEEHNEKEEASEHEELEEVEDDEEVEEAEPEERNEIEDEKEKETDEKRKEAEIEARAKEKEAQVLRSEETEKATEEHHHQHPHPPGTH